LSASSSPPQLSPEPPADLGVAVRNGWDGRASKRFVGLALARVVAQFAGFAWFVISARALGPAEFGRLAAGLTFFALFAGIGDLGTTRTIVRHVAADHRLLASAFRQATGLRVSWGLLTAALTLGALSVITDAVSLPVVAIAGLVAVASGVTELGYAGLRAVGRVRAEAALLLFERVGFLVAATIYVRGHHSAVGIMLIYLASNSVSAIAVSTLIISGRSALRSPPVSFTDRQARLTAAEFALATVSPRISALVLILMATPAGVGVFVAAQRPIEAMALLALSTAAPVLPIVRSRLLAGRRVDAERAAVSVAAALMLVAGPLLAWLAVRPESVLTILFGTEPDGAARLTVRLLALTAVTWTFRGVAEFVLLAEERAGAALRIMTIGVAVNLAGCLLLVPRHGAAGAAIAMLVAEVVMTAAIVAALPRMVDRSSLPDYAPALGLAAITAIGLGWLGASAGGALGVLAVATVVAAFLALRTLRGLEVAT